MILRRIFYEDTYRRRGPTSLSHGYDAIGTDPSRETDPSRYIRQQHYREHGDVYMDLDYSRRALALFWI